MQHTASQYEALCFISKQSSTHPSFHTQNSSHASHAPSPSIADTLKPLTPISHPLYQTIGVVSNQVPHLATVPAPSTKPILIITTPNQQALKLSLPPSHQPAAQTSQSGCSTSHPTHSPIKTHQAKQSAQPLPI
ncbi:hypothetical protein KIL84_003487 [Mauremys mutica]|uniref:Uncharacterized protein n=1 Tax=Mauremys mutica TaxID=74926 RepID=A0A9D3WTW2_9SAUR|nr:hypothetical protein KIL84_003487 [Mauremys mutica]